MVLERFMKYVALICVLFLAGCGEESANNNQEKLVVGISADYPPFEFLDHGQMRGFDIDFAKKIAEEMDREIKIKEIPFSGLIPALQNGSVDMLASAVSITEKRKEFVDFSNIYYYSDAALLFDIKNVKIFSFSDIIGKKVGVKNGTAIESFLKDNKSKLNIEIISQGNDIDLAQSLELGKIEVLAIDLKQAKKLKNVYEDFDFIEIKEDNEYGFALAFNKGSDLVQPVNKILKKLEENEWIDDLKEKWGNYGFAKKIAKKIDENAFEENVESIVEGNNSSQGNGV